MKSRVNLLLFLILSFSITLTACGGNSTDTADLTPSASATPDLCAPEAIKGEIDQVNRLMREFDDASLLAANTARDLLRPAIAELQRIRRDAEDQLVPPCLSDLKQIQLAHMNLVIATLTGFMGSSDQQSVTDGINRARQLHDKYTLEIARLLGITLVPITAPVQLTDTPVANAPATPAAVTISNPGPTTVNMRAAPALDALNLGLLEVGLSALVLGRSADNQWLLIEVPGQPGQTAWVFTSLVTLTDTLDIVPVVTPTP